MAIGIAMLVCCPTISPALAQDGSELEPNHLHPTEIYVACKQPAEKICADLKAAVLLKPSLTRIEYRDMNPSAFTAYLSTQDGRRSEVASVHVFGLETDFTLRSGVPFPEISRDMEYWSKIVSATLLDAIVLRLEQ